MNDDIEEVKDLMIEVVKSVCAGEGGYNSKYQKLKNDILLPNWSQIYKRYEQYGQSKVDGKGRNSIYFKNKWSVLNQFNTNSTIQQKIITFLNKKILIDFPETYEQEKIWVNPDEILNYDYLCNCIENYFIWLNFYFDDIFIDLNNVNSTHFLYELMEMGYEIMGNGTFCELIGEYQLKLMRRDCDVLRIGGRGSQNDMLNGVDIEVIDRETKKIELYQSKKLKLYGMTIYGKLNYEDYLKKGITHILLFSMGDKKYDDKMHIIELTLNTFSRIEKNGGTNILLNPGYMQNIKISNMFKSEALLKFWIYVSKNDIPFIMDIGDETKFEYNKEENKIYSILPKDGEKFNKESLSDVWTNLIRTIEKEENVEYEIEKLKEALK
jgi:hypothetical protein